MRCHALCTAVGPASGVMPMAGCLGLEANASWSLVCGTFVRPKRLGQAQLLFRFLALCAGLSLQAVFLPDFGLFSHAAACANGLFFFSPNSLSNMNPQNTITVGSHLGLAKCRTYHAIMLIRSSLKFVLFAETQIGSEINFCANLSTVTLQYNRVGFFFLPKSPILSYTIFSFEQIR